MATPHAQSETHPGARGASRSEGTGSPRNRCVGSVQLRVELRLQVTSTTSIRIAVSGRSSSNIRIPKAYALTTTTCTSNKRSAQLMVRMCPRPHQRHATRDRDGAGVRLPCMLSQGSARVISGHVGLRENASALLLKADNSESRQFCEAAEIVQAEIGISLPLL